MEQALQNLSKILSQLIGYHRQLLEVVRAEYEALIAAQSKNIQEITYSKEALIHSIQMAESERKKAVAGLAPFLRLPVEGVTLSQIIIQVQGKDLKKADQLRSAMSTLSLLIDRIREQNATSGKLVEKSLEHISTMKKNVAGTVSAGSLTYTQSGQKAKAFREKKDLSEKV